MTDAPGTGIPDTVLQYTVTPDGEAKDWNKPDISQVKIWTWGFILVVGIIYCMGVGALPFIALTIGFEYFIAALVALCSPLTFARRWANRQYENYGFAFTASRIYIKKGVFTTEFTAIDYSRIQNVDVTQGTIERRRGLSTVRIETAGGGSTRAEGIIEGIRNPHEVSEFLMAKAAAARSIMPPGPRTAGVPDLPGGPGSPLFQVEFPGGLLKELKERNRLLREISKRM